MVYIYIYIYIYAPHEWDSAKVVHFLQYGALL